MSQILELNLPHPEDTDRLGAAFFAVLQKNAQTIARQGLTIRLEGNLGAGKTTFVRAVLRAAGFTGPVKSPTFSLVETYPLLGVTLNHFDFYRFEDPMEFEDAGFRDLFGPGYITATEWTDKAAPFVPPADLTLTLAIDGLGRRASLNASSELGSALVSALAAEVSHD